MAVYSTWWQASNDNVTFTNMPSPSVFKSAPSDLDSQNYRSCITGVRIRNRKRSNIGKWELSFNALTAADLNTILTAISNEHFFIKIREGSSLSGSKKVNSDSINFSAVEGTQRWNLSFNLIEY